MYKFLLMSPSWPSFVLTITVPRPETLDETPDWRFEGQLRTSAQSVDDLQAALRLLPAPLGPGTLDDPADAAALLAEAYQHGDSLNERYWQMHERLRLLRGLVLDGIRTSRGLEGIEHLQDCARSHGRLH